MVLPPNCQVLEEPIQVETAVTFSASHTTLTISITTESSFQPSTNTGSVPFLAIQ